MLGLDPTDPHSAFKVRAARQPVSGYPQISWDSIGGKTYTIQYANSLAASGAFNPAQTIMETNVPAGVSSTHTFVDDYTLTGAPPGSNGRYYRIKFGGP